MRVKGVLILLFALASLPLTLIPAHAARILELPPGFVEDTPLTGFSRPIAFAWFPDGRMVVGEKLGAIRLVKNGKIAPATMLTLSVTHKYDAGLLGLEVDPRFPAQPYLYVYYTIGDKSLNFDGIYRNRVSRFRVEGDFALLASEQILIDDIPVDQVNNHNGGDLRFGPDGMLYISTGDGGRPEDAQNLDSMLGKILRVDPGNGYGVTDNPFAGPFNSQERNRVWAYGLRNPFRFVFKPGTDQIYAGDVGAQTYEELNLVLPGRNYGWPMQEGLNALNTVGVEHPLFWYGRAYNQNPDFDTCPSIIGGDFVRGRNFPASFAGGYFFGDYACNRIWYKMPDAAPVRFAREVSGPVHIGFGPDGMLYYTSIVGNAVHRIRYVAGNRPPVAAAMASQQSGVLPLVVSFRSDGSADPDGDAVQYAWNFGDGRSSSDPNPVHVYKTAGTYVATLTVTDAYGATTKATPIRVWAGNAAPKVTIESPVDGQRVRIGQEIVLRGHAVDDEEGELVSNTLSWEAVLHHGTSHTHLWDTATGPEVRFTMPRPEDLATAATSYLEITLTARDRVGATGTHTIRILHDTVNLTFQTEPPNLLVKLDGRMYRAPVTIASAKGWAFAVRDFFQTAPDCRGYRIGSWSNGRPPTHVFVTPTVDASLTATMIDVPASCAYLPLVMTTP